MRAKLQCPALPPGASACTGIDGWPGYVVDTDGRVWSSKRGSWRELAYGRDPDGYVTVQVTQSGRSTQLRVHKVVASAFKRGRLTAEAVRDLGLEVRHLDGDKLNNNSANLEYGTRKENADDRERHGRTARGERNLGGRKLTEAQVSEIKHALAVGNTLTSIARAYGVSIGLIHHIKVGRLWRHVR